MLQRIQSLYLFIAAVAFAMLFFMNIYKVETKTDPVAVFTINATVINHFQSTTTEPIQPLFQLFSFSLNLISFVLIIVTIFWYKNRVQQNLFARFLILLNSGLLVVLLLNIDKLKGLVGPIPYNGVYQPGIALPFISLVLIYLASRAIMKDEKLIRSADRLR